MSEFEIPKSDFEIISEPDEEALKRDLRNVTLNGDPQAYPYETAQIDIVDLPIEELRPTAYYVLEEREVFVKGLHEKLETQGLSLYTLSGVMRLRWQEKEFSLAPPIIERYEEPGMGEVRVIVDGLHRIMLARQRGIEAVRCVEISGVGPEYPLVPLPLTWDDVGLYEKVPPIKRKYRFPTAQAAIGAGIDKDRFPLTDENVSYFFYRDLSVLGSSGIRK